MWKEDKINAITKQLEEIENHKLSTQTMIEHYQRQFNNAETQRAALVDTLQKLQNL